VFTFAADQDALVQEQGTCCTPTAALSYDGLAAIKEEQLFSQVSSATPSGSLVPINEAASSRLIYNGELPIPENLTDHMLEVGILCRLSLFYLLISSCFLVHAEHELVPDAGVCKRQNRVHLHVNRQNTRTLAGKLFFCHKKQI
jgi:hypothetical protein